MDSLAEAVVITLLIIIGTIMLAFVLDDLFD